MEAAASVKVLWPLPGVAMLRGANVAVTPLGNPLAVRAMEELNPAAGAVLRVTGVEAPGVTLALDALADSVKPGGGKMVRANVRSLVVFPPTAPSVRL